METIKLHILHTGTVIVDEALPYHRDTDSPIAWTGFLRGKKHRMELPVSVYLIEHPKGLVLIDTGWHTDNRHRQLRNLSFQWFVNKAVLPEGQTVHEQLAKLGYSPSDIDAVVLSHLHCDHADGLRLVKEAKKILVSEPEWQTAKKDRFKYLHHEWKGVDLQTFTLTKTGKGPQGMSYDLFGDGSIEFIWIPGHSDGLCATTIKNTQTGRYILLTSDAGYSPKNWEENLTPGVVSDREKAREALEWVRQTVRDPLCQAAFANHDPNLDEQVIEI
ncbi:N-acyl homoserine lactonase family protein [Streptococcus chenjunshii]|uniref:N-acyl homoserine lactonase family protein n=1 Tax=Streptococcus chenjunshii TaxID=2173853 RepID=A0A372KN15_9STRE|nr:N-acyl homoserine lactonase family protein [Streptococcus chenjunshii]AXQ78794.1 N-acyl homoserine lactonase family protein [Streptococcus chenjunshii]RFU51555.1 N-acyl homoserine lactonase family protein [Streptococcus chenjunshii]RFU53675.1 N-acyl homoserine lactonase family protein [Streptococcus chenjunshii]